MSEDVMNDVREEINDFCLHYTSKDKAATLANEIEDMMLDTYSRNTLTTATHNILTQVKKLDNANSDYKALMLLGLFDKAGLEIQPNGRQAALDHMLTTKNGVPNAKSRENIRLILENDPHYQGLLKWNSFTEQAEYRKSGLHDNYVPVDDEFTNRLAADKIGRAHV